MLQSKSYSESFQSNAVCRFHLAPDLNEITIKILFKLIKKFGMLWVLHDNGIVVMFFRKLFFEYP